MATDKKLNSVSAVTDAAYVYAETSDGTTVKISKADLASVVAEIIQFTDKKVTFIASSNTWYRIVKLGTDAAFLLTLAKTWSNGTPSSCILYVSGGSVNINNENMGYVEKIAGISNGTSFFTKARIVKDDNAAYLELFYSSALQNKIQMTFFGNMYNISPSPSESSLEGNAYSEIDLTI